jgi:hypothetical protein
MKQLKLNPDFLRRHLAVCILMFGIGCWFGYDGLVTYPKTPAAELYEQIEKSKPKEGFPLEAFKKQKIQSQYGFMALCFLASVLIGLNIASAARFRFEWDESSFVWKGKKRPISDVKSVNRAQWKKKGIIKLELVDGDRVVLDAWHHAGVKEFVPLLPSS